MGPCESASGKRCSDKGFWATRRADYLELLDWTARRNVPGKHRTAAGVPPILVRLGLDRATWCELVDDLDACSVARRGVLRVRTQCAAAEPTAATIPAAGLASC